MSQEKIENRVVLPDTDDMIATLANQGLPREGVAMVLDHATALDFVRNNVVGKALTPELVTEVNHLVMKHADQGIEWRRVEWRASGLDETHVFRRSTVHVHGSPVVHPYPHEVPVAMDKLIQIYEDAKKAGADPLVAGILFHFCFLYVHPFRDGNGQTARLLLAVMLHDAALFGCIIRETNRPLYMSFFDEFYDHGSVDALYTYFFWHCRVHTSMIIGYHSLPSVSPQ